MPTMATEEKVETTTTTEETQETKVDAEAEETTEESEESKDKASHTDKIDYKAIADKEQDEAKRRKEAATERFKKSEAKRQETPEIEDEEEEEKPLTKSEFRGMMLEQQQTTQKTLQAARIREIAKDLATSTEEAEAIIAVHSNRIFPAHLTLEDQLDEAFAIVNFKLLKGQNAELKRALKGKAGVKTDGATTHQTESKSSGKAPSVSTAVTGEAGFKWNHGTSRHEKKTSTGKLLIRDEVTGKVSQAL